ncbi:MAG: ribosome silencing factor [Spirochaetales bacterium]
MEDTANNQTLVMKVAKFIEDQKGRDTIVLYLGPKCSFTDYFIITTVTSSAHLQGLFYNLLSFLDELNVELIRKKKNMDDSGWELLDCGSFVIHLMTEEKRSFYDLEKLWFESERMYYSSSS